MEKRTTTYRVEYQTPRHHVSWYGEKAVADKAAALARRDKLRAEGRPARVVEINVVCREVA